MLVTSTEAPAIAPPDWSITRPTMVPRDSCAKAAGSIASITRRIRSTGPDGLARRVFNIAKTPLLDPDNGENCPEMRDCLDPCWTFPYMKGSNQPQETGYLPVSI